MDISKFLNSGTTFLHGAARSVTLTVGAALVAGLAAQAQASERASQISDVARPADMTSLFYQQIGAPGSRDTIIVSTHSPSLKELMNQLPEPFSKAIEVRASITGTNPRIHSLESILGKQPGEAYSYRVALQGGTQSVCFTNAAEAIADKAEGGAGGINYVSLKTPGGIENIHSADDAMFHSTIHEIYHCTTRTDYAAKALAQHGENGISYGVAIDEMLADLAVALAYASREGSFDNGMASLRGMRAAGLSDLQHHTEDMLDIVIAKLDPGQAQGMTPAQIMQATQRIGLQLDPINNAELKAAYAKTAIEKTLLAKEVFGENPEIESLTEKTVQAIDAEFDLDTRGRAAKITEVILTLKIKNAALMHAMPGQGIASMESLADQLGTSLTAAQKARASVFDAGIFPDGPATSPVPSDANLSMGSHMDDLFSEHLQRFDSQMER